MSNIPSFKISSKPQLSQAEVDAKRPSGGGNILNDPGTYDFLIKKFTFGDLNKFDNSWINAAVVLETPDGKELTHYLDVPVECRNSFLLDGKTKGLDNLTEFLRGLGIQFDFDNGMTQVAEVFGNPEQLIGKSIKAVAGYYGPHIKYVGKVDNVAQYVIVEKDHETIKVEGVFADRKAAEAAADENGLKGKLQKYIKVTRIFAAKEPVLVVGAAAPAAIDEIPF